HRGALRALRLASRPCVSRRSAADGPALLHQRRGDRFHPGASVRAGLTTPAATLASGKVGVLIVNLGTPEATDYWAMRRYLKEFLSDRRVIETPRWLWWPILNLGILTKRPRAKGKDYDA